MTAANKVGRYVERKIVNPTVFVFFFSRYGGHFDGVTAPVTNVTGVIINLVMLLLKGCCHSKQSLLLRLGHKI